MMTASLMEEKIWHDSKKALIISARTGGKEGTPCGRRFVQGFPKEQVP